MEGKAFASATTTSATQQEQRIVTQELKRTQQVLTSDLQHADVSVSHQLFYRFRSSLYSNSLLITKFSLFTNLFRRWRLYFMTNCTSSRFTSWNSLLNVLMMGDLWTQKRRRSVSVSSADSGTNIDDVPPGPKVYTGIYRAEVSSKWGKIQRMTSLSACVLFVGDNLAAIVLFVHYLLVGRDWCSGLGDGADGRLRLTESELIRVCLGLPGEKWAGPRSRSTIVKICDMRWSFCFESFC